MGRWLFVLLVAAIAALACTTPGIAVTHGQARGTPRVATFAPLRHVGPRQEFRHHHPFAVAAAAVSVDPQSAPPPYPYSSYAFPDPDPYPYAFRDRPMTVEQTPEDVTIVRGPRR
jgi:hypothetical protein